MVVVVVPSLMVQYQSPLGKDVGKSTIIINCTFLTHGPLAVVFSTLPYVIQCEK